MPLSPGDKLGPYEIIAPIGAGGMGEVWKARDPRLNRDVAIKVSAAQFSEHFEREAKAIAALNHPNICQVYDVGPNYLVMEFIEGESPKGPMLLDEALRIARQIAEALEAAHEKGITHRDLKPGNIKIKPDGTVKVLDFGLAKVGRAAGATSDNSPTLTLGMTEAGMILGTAAYMAPEQARGKETVDKRADIWAFGVVLYEMLTGKRLFEGEDVGDILASVIKEQPNLDEVPQQVRPLLKRCLEKDPKKRLRDIGDMELLLGGAGSADGAGREPAAASRPAKRMAIAAAAVMTLLAAGLGIVAYRATRLVAHPLMSFTDDLDAEVSLGVATGPALAISPDSTRLVFVSRGSDGETTLSQRLLQSPKSMLLAGTDGASAPFFSPDSRWIAFFADQKLKKISVEGGLAVTLCDVGVARGGFWGEDGNILFSNQRASLMRVSSSGGTPHPATELDKQKGEVTNRFAQLLPGGEAFLFTASKDNNAWEDANIQVQTVTTGKRKTLVEGGYFGRYLPGGYIVYVHGGTLFAAPMDLKRLELTGPALPVLEDISGHANNGFPQFDFTSSGTFVYVKGAPALSQYSLSWLDATGNTQNLSAQSGDYRGVRTSPDGTRIAVRILEGSSLNLSVYDWAQNRMTRLTFLKGGSLGNPTWTPDSKHIVFPLASPVELSGPGFYWIRADGAGEPLRLLEGQNADTYSFSPDGKRLAYMTYGPDYAIWTLPLDLADPEHPKPGKPELFLQSKFVVRTPAFSPDGRWMAYSSAESGRNEVFVRPFPGPGGKWQISTSGGINPIWSRTGKELFYFFSDGRIRVAQYTANGDSFVASQPRMWSEKAPAFGPAPDVMPDGKRFVVELAPSAANSAERQTHVTFLLNFTDELRRKVPASK